MHLLWLVSDKGGMNVSDSFYCSLHCLRQLHSRQKLHFDEKWGLKSMESLGL